MRDRAWKVVDSFYQSGLEIKLSPLKSRRKHAKEQAIKMTQACKTNKVRNTKQNQQAINQPYPQRKIIRPWKKRRT